MKPGKLSLCAAVSAVLLVGTGGCFPQEVNDLINGGVKLAGGRIGELTAGELKAVSDAAIALISGENGQNLEPLTREQAQALVDFFRANGINTFNDLAALPERFQNDPDSIQGLDQLALVFGQAGEDFDPSRLEALLAALFAWFNGGGAGG